MIKAGKVRALAVLCERRLPTLPDVPTSKEAGVDNFTMSIWYGMFAPAATPREIIARLNREVTKALGSPDMRERLAAAGIDPWPGTPEQMGNLLRSETARFAVLIRAAGLPRE
jgi:tripartite-type tricarboxylate transporter receptor subunit TctC